MSTDLPRHYVFYLKLDGREDFEWPEDGEIEYGIHTNSAVGSVRDAQIWVISGRGEPKEFSLCYTFRAEAVQALADGKGHRILGYKGAPFDPPFSLNQEPWFAELRRKQFWSLGLSEVKSEVVLEIFDELYGEIFEDDEPLELEGVEEIFEKEVAESVSQPSEVRLQRLADAPKLPERLEVLSTYFLRNPDVIAEVLHRAKGICGKCGKPAPFNRKSDGSPYLEVHHWIPLSEGGEDTLENAVALCPNCHREAHFG